MSAVRTVTAEVTRQIDVKRNRAAENRRQAERLLRLALEIDREADVLAAMLEASGMGQEATVHFLDPKVA